MTVNCLRNDHANATVVLAGMRVHKLNYCPLLHLLLLLLLLPFPRDLFLRFKQQQHRALCDQVLLCTLWLFAFLFLTLYCPALDSRLAYAAHIPRLPRCSASSFLAASLALFTFI